MRRSILALSLLLIGSSAWAMRPIVQFHDLIAGQPTTGYRDGAFNTAQFNEPQGLCFDQEGARLFVADKGNNCIRVIYRDEQNRVETLAGSTEPGHVNGSLKSARFNKPNRLTWAGKDLLVVYDSGNNRLRAIDLAKSEVRDLAGNGYNGDVDGKALESSLGPVWAIQTVPSDNAIYLSEPNSCKLRKLDLTQNVLSTIGLSDKICPGALCLDKDQLCITNWGNGYCYLFDSKNNYAKMIGDINNEPGSNFRSLFTATSNDDLYAYEQADVPRWIKLSTKTPIKFFTAWGREMTAQKFPGTFLAHTPMSFIADPREKTKFYITAENLPFVMSLKDYNFAKGEDIGTYNNSGMTDFDYPTQKPANTFRILVCGNSLSYSMSFEDQRENNWNRSDAFPKQLELMLNATAAFEDVPLNYEVFSLGHPESFDPSFLWPYYEVPDLVKKFDIDLVLYVIPTLNNAPYAIYYQNPMTKEGIPQKDQDNEYLLKPLKDKIPPGAAQDLYDRCLKKGWVTSSSASQLTFEPYGKTLSDPNTYRDVLELTGKPIHLLRDKLAVMKTSAGVPVECEMVLIYRDEANAVLQPLRDFWKDLAQKTNFPYLDIVDDFLAFKPTYEGFYSYEDFHYKAPGTNIYCYLVSQELIRHKVIPFPTEK